MESESNGAKCRIITKKELLAMVPLTPQHILRLEKQGKFPKRIRLGARKVGWWLPAVMTWIEERMGVEMEANGIKG